MKTISAENKARLRAYCVDRGKAAISRNSTAADMAKMFEVFFYLGSLCRTSSKYSLAKEIKRTLYGAPLASVFQQVTEAPTKTQP